MKRMRRGGCALKDPFNPTREEILEWAYDAESYAPEEDFDLYITDVENADLLLMFVADPTCPKRRFFLSCLYLLVGDTVRSEGKAHDLAQVERILDVAVVGNNVDVGRWVALSRDLIAHPEKFDYDAWCSGGLAYGSIDPEGDLG